MTEKADWLAGLRKGDPVVVRSYQLDVEDIHRVTRFTGTLIITNCEQRFRRTDGGEFLTSSWWLEKPTAAQARKAGKVAR